MENVIRKSLAEQFKPLVLLLKILHPYRIRLEQSPEAGSVTYKTFKVSWRNPLSFGPWGLFLWNTFASLTFAFNSGLGIPFPMNL